MTCAGTHKPADYAASEITVALSSRTSPQRCVPSIGGEAVQLAGAAGVDERLLAAPLAHMRGIPRGVAAALPVGVTEHGAGAVRRYGRVGVCRHRQGHAVR